MVMDLNVGEVLECVVTQPLTVVVNYDDSHLARKYNLSLNARWLWRKETYGEALYTFTRLVSLKSSFNWKLSCVTCEYVCVVIISNII